ncbi:MAG: ATP-binding cassette domain-containing protein [Pseudomonadota bacterium]
MRGAGETLDSASPIAQDEEAEAVIKVRGLVNQFGRQVVHDNLDLTVRRGEVLGLVGGSGSGKSVLLRTIVGLIKPKSGRITVLGHEMQDLSPRARQAVQSRWGVLFQDGALFSSLTVGQNVAVPLREHTRLSPQARDDLVALKLALVGLPAESAAKYPSEISGGMRKRVGLARALALDAEILFLDEPTAGLDPISAAAFDQLIRTLQATLGLTVVLVTHDLDTLYTTCDRVAALLRKQVTVGTIEELSQVDDPWIQEYFLGPRGRAALTAEERRLIKAAQMSAPQIQVAGA